MAENVGSGRRFRRLESKLAAKGAKNPGALAAFIGRRKYGKARFAQLAAAGRRRGKDQTTAGQKRTKV